MEFEPGSLGWHFLSKSQMGLLEDFPALFKSRIVSLSQVISSVFASVTGPFHVLDRALSVDETMHNSILKKAIVMKIIVSATVLFVGISLCLGSVSQAQFYTLNPGDGLVNGISDNGIAVGSFGNNDGEYFMWEVGVGGKVNIGGVPAGDGVGGQANISNDGTKVCGTDLASGSGMHEMSLYDVATASWTHLGGIGSSSGSEISSGWNISGDGLSVVGLGWVNAGEGHACHWRNGVMTDLGTTSGTDSSRANAVSFDGSVVAGWQDGVTRQGAVWVNGVQELIFKPDQSPALESSAISNDGRYVTGIDVGPFFGQGNTYRYDVVTDTTIELGNLVDGESRMGGACISDDGTLIGGGTWPLGPAFFGQGFIWEEGVGTVKVEDYLTAKGVSGWSTDFVFNFVSAMSSDGSWIAGWGREGASGASVSWVAHISTGPQVVVPSSFTVTRGTYVSGGEPELAESDNSDLSIRRNTSDIQSVVEFVVKATSLTDTPSSFEFTLESSVFARSTVDQTIECFDYENEVWEEVDTRPASRFSDATVVVGTTGDLSRFVELSTGCIEARIRYRSLNPRQSFSGNIDQTIWTIE